MFWVALVAVATGLTVLILAPDLYTPLPAPRCRIPRERGRPRGRAVVRGVRRPGAVRAARRGRPRARRSQQYPDRGPYYGRWRRAQTGCSGSSSAALLAGTAVLVLDRPTARLDPRTASELIEDVFSAAGVADHPSQRGLDRVDRVVSMAADEMTAWGIQT